MMNRFFENVPNIIGEAARSPLGLLALMIIALSVLAFFFFRSSSDKVRAAMFVLLFVGVVCFGVAAVRSIPSGSTYTDSPSIQESTKQKQTATELQRAPDRAPNESAPASQRQSTGKGEVVTDMWGFKALGINEMEIYPTRYSDRDMTIEPIGANDKLLVVPARLTNRTDKVLTLASFGNITYKSKVIDNEGLLYSCIRFDGRSEQEIAPGGSVEFALVFNIPKKARPAKLSCVLDWEGLSKIEMPLAK
jgi:hypothetical protein